MQPNEVITVILNPGDVLSVSTDSTATCVVTKLPNNPGDAYPNVQHSIAASGLKRIGPFAGTSRWSIATANGIVTYSFGKLDIAQNITSITKVVTTNGVTPVNVFDSAGAPCGLKVTSINTIALDVTVSNIIFKDAAGTIATIPKRIDSVTLAASLLTNINISAGGYMTVESSSTGNVIAIITFDVV